jgi:hypothetical protein
MATSNNMDNNSYNNYYNLHHGLSQNMSLEIFGLSANSLRPLRKRCDGGEKYFTPLRNYRNVRNTSL